MPFTFNSVLRRRLQIKFKQSLKAALTHPAVSDQVLVHLPFHDPFVKPNKLVSLLYRIV